MGKTPIREIKKATLKDSHANDHEGIGCHEKGQRPFQPIFPLSPKSSLGMTIGSTRPRNPRAKQPPSSHTRSIKAAATEDWAAVRTPYRQQDAACRLPETSSTKNNKGSRRCLRAGTVPRCCARRAGHQAQCGFSPRRNIVCALLGECPSQAVWTTASGYRISGLSYEEPAPCFMGAAARSSKYAGRRRGTDRFWLGHHGP
jgi:hypothetical protein